MSSNTFVGSKISLISKAGIRYEGTLVDINAAESTVSLDNVLSYGTEGRPAPQVFPPCKTPYAYVKFRGSDIADLHVYENPPKAAPAQPLQDPAIIEASQNSSTPALTPGQLSPGGPVGNSTFSNSFNSQAASSYSHPGAYPHATPSAPTPANSFEQSDANDVNAASGSPAPTPEPSNDTAQQNGESEGRDSNYRGRGRNTVRRNSYRRYREGMPYTNKTLKFEADFDFSAANAKFNKDDLEQEFNKKLEKLCLSDGSDTEADPIEGDAIKEGDVIKRDGGEEEEEDEEQCYDKQKSFFDSISCEALEKENGQRRRPNSWQVERSLNSETFGEGVISFQRRNYQGNYRGRGGMNNGGPPHNGYMNNYHNNRGGYNNYRGRGGDHNNSYYRGGYRNYDNNNNGYRNNNGYNNREQNEGGYRSYNNNRSEGGYDNRRGGGNNEGYSGGYNNRRDNNNGQQQGNRQPRYNNYYERSNEDGPRHNYRRSDRGSRTQTEAT